MAEPPVQAGDVLAGKYMVERILGSGGMGIVVAAWHQELEQRVAVKFLLPEIAQRSDAAERFRREARAAVKIRSEHVARVLDVGTLDGVAPYMVMEYLDGHDLAQELRDRGQMPIAESISYILQACEAVAEAHSMGVVHRDLKPANLFLARRNDGSVSVKVLDFGISKSVMGSSIHELSLTRTSSIIGSPLYMSPEQMRSARDVDTRTDIWAMGAIVYEMLTGRPPYLADNVAELCASLLNDAPPPMRDFRPDVGPELESVLLRCLAKDRNQRWQTVADFAQALVGFAPRSMHIHAERARRVLGGSDAGLIDTGNRRASGGYAGYGSSGTLLSTPPGELPRGQSRVSNLSPPAAVERSDEREPTLASWGRTDNDDAQSRSRRRKLVVVALGSAAVLALVTIVFLRGFAADAGAVSGQPAASPVPELAPIKPVATTEAREAATEAKASQEAPATPSLSSSARQPLVAPTASVMPSAARPVAPRAQARVAPRASRPRSESSKAVTRDTQSEAAPSSITDFGGRR